MLKLVEEKIQKLLELRKEGYTASEIAKILECSKATVSKYFKEYGIGNIINNMYDDTVDKKILIRFTLLIGQHKTNDEIKQELKITDDDFYNLLFKYKYHRHYKKEFTEEEKEQLQKRYEELGNIKLLAKESHISRNTLMSFIKLKNRGINKMTGYEKLKSYRKRVKEKLVKYKGGKCELCGYCRCYSALDFHHIDPENKSFHISANLNKSFDTLKKEVDKCIMVCANCHREIHEGIRNADNNFRFDNE